MIKGKKILLIQILGFLLLGLLFARLNYSEMKLERFFTQFDVVMHVLMILGTFIMSIGLKNSRNSRS